MSNQADKNRRSAFYLGLLVVGMFGFGFAMIPLYQLICDVTGINNISQGTDFSSGRQPISLKVDTSRLITIEFDVTNNAGLPWELHPKVKKMQVHPGEIHEVSFFVKNNSNREIVAQAIPGVTPWQATESLNKIECFCFTQQTLKPGESKDMPLRFVINHDLPEGIDTLTLSYTFMDQDRSKLKHKGGV